MIVVLLFLVPISAADDAAAALALAKAQRDRPKIQAVAAPASVPASSIGRWNLPAYRDRMPRGAHYHVCASCGQRWQHTDASNGILADHICPACGVLPPHESNSRLQSAPFCPLPGGK